MANERKRYSEITILYVAATLIIFVNHTIQGISHAVGAPTSGTHVVIKQIITSIGAAGVPIFLFTGGFLAGIKKIENGKEWIIKKCQRILIPFFIVFLLLTVIYLIIGAKVSLKQFFILLFDLQGLQNYFLINVNFYTAPAGMGHFWYVSIYLICSLLTVVLNKYYERINLKIILIALFVLQPILLLCHIHIIYILAYFIGYYVSKSKIELSNKKYVILTCVVIFLMALRVVLRKFIDGILYYDFLVAPTQNMILGIWIFATVFFIRKKLPDLVDRIAEIKFVKVCASLTLEIYLIHFITVMSEISVFKIIDNIWVANAAAVVITAILAVLLQKATNKINGFIDSKK